MARDAYASVRLPRDLKLEVERVANATSRTLSSTIELLLRRGVERFKDDGLLIELPRPRRKPKEPTDEQIAQRMADMVAERLLKLIQEQSDEHSRQDRAA